MQTSRTRRSNQEQKDAQGAGCVESGKLFGIKTGIAGQCVMAPLSWAHARARDGLRRDYSCSLIVAARIKPIRISQYVAVLYSVCFHISGFGLTKCDLLAICPSIQDPGLEHTPATTTTAEPTIAKENQSKKLLLFCGNCSSIHFREERYPWRRVFRR